MHVICMRGAWCGDCVDQSPMQAFVEEQSLNIEIRFIDRDYADPALKEAIKICGGNRVPTEVRWIR
ncbi:hypothetical protein GC197_08145 [bacterium]|nr:hypothetical protein [bacterium]